MYALSVLCLLLVFAGSRSAAEDVNSLPKPTGYLNDFAHVTDAASAAQIEQFCTSVEQQLGVQFALVTIQGTDDRPIRDYALDLFRKWGVGSKKDNQGLLLLLAVRDHKSDVETGRGIEPYITDGFAGSTLRAMRPDLRNSQYGAALFVAARTMAAQIAQGKNIAFDSGALPPPPPIEDHPRRETRSVRGIPIPLIVLGIFFLFWLIGRIGRRGGPRGGPGGYGGGGGFPTGLILGSLLGGRGGFGGGGNWGGGGFGGGGGGGGGFGGFGGGDAGGGGASSDW